jgi:hypothetical protein
MVAFGTTALNSLGPNKTRFDWTAVGSPLSGDLHAVLKADLQERFDGLIVAMANQLVWKGCSALSEPFNTFEGSLSWYAFSRTEEMGKHMAKNTPQLAAVATVCRHQYEGQGFFGGPKSIFGWPQKIR